MISAQTRRVCREGNRCALFRIMLQHANSGELIAARGFRRGGPGGSVRGSVKGGSFGIMHSVHFGLILVAALIFAFLIFAFLILALAPSVLASSQPAAPPPAPLAPRRQAHQVRRTAAPARAKRTGLWCSPSSRS